MYACKEDDIFRTSVYGLLQIYHLTNVNCDVFFAQLYFCGNIALFVIITSCKNKK